MLLTSSAVKTTVSAPDQWQNEGTSDKNKDLKQFMELIYRR